MKTGFRAYAIYLFVKNLHFKDNNFNVMTLKKTPMKDKLLASWNNKRRKQDGIQFQAIEKECSNIKSLAILYSSYYVNNPNFYIREIFEDDFSIYKNNIAELKSLDNFFTNELNHVLMYVKENELKTKDLFVGSGSIPLIFKMNLSFNTLVIMNDLFNILEKNKDLEVNSLEKERWKSLLIRIKWYKPIIKDYLDKTNWKELAYEILKN